MEALSYIHLKPGTTPPEFSDSVSFKAVVVVECEVSPQWQAEVSDWLVRSGCLYMMAWGHECSSWDDSVDFANLDQFDFDDIPDDRSVMTTWHEDEPLAEVFWFCIHCAEHATVEVKTTVIVHIAAEGRPTEMLEAFLAVQQRSR